MRVTRTISCGVSCHVSCVTGGMEWQRVRFRFLRGEGRKRKRERKKHNSHSVILEKLSAGTSKEIESVDDETSPAKRDKTLKKKLSHFLWRLFFKWLNANCGKRNRYTVDMFNYWATCSKKGFLNALNTSTGVFLSISSSDKILYSLI